jgi:hypothetical protein
MCGKKNINNNIKKCKIEKNSKLKSLKSLLKLNIFQHVKQQRD